VASPAPSPFSADKRADVVEAVRALLKGLLALAAAASPVSTGSAAAAHGEEK
jgi:hypothetical protein